VRALQLSGAFGGLLGAMPPRLFLTAANDYLIRQEWEEGFATAVHLSVDLRTGAFEVRTAGHPPAALRLAGSGRWSVLGTEGPILGLVEDAVFAVVEGSLRRGDALLLYTDGMVELPRRDIDMGIDRMLGEVERMVRGDLMGATQRLVDTLGSRSDDRAMLLLTRT
jgi:serine phosphatase RsbU (regulator of sigma subunit)